MDSIPSLATSQIVDCSCLEGCGFCSKLAQALSQQALEMPALSIRAWGQAMVRCTYACLKGSLVLHGVSC